MGLGILGGCLVIVLCFRPVFSQQPNTDGFYVSDFLKKMGLDLNLNSNSNSPETANFSAHFCARQGVFCDSERESVVKLVVSGLGLSGVIPENTIGKLTKLESLDLSDNAITGLPSDVWSLGHLKSFNLSMNKVSGNLPSNIGNFGQLESLDLSFNNFSGSIPEAMSSLENLRVLNLRANKFDSKIPFGILNCRSLVYLDLSENKLNDSLHDGFGAAFPNLQFLSLADNEVVGKGTDFSGMTSLVFLNISGNLFDGSVAGVFGGPLEVIDLSRNQFRGHISQVNFSSSLVYLDLSENQFTGEISRMLNDEMSLKHVNLADNRFTPQRFPSVDMLSGLEYLNLSRTSLVGEIPSLKTRMLRVLDVSFNNLSGDIPLSIMQTLPSMQRFNFSYNNLTFCASNIPPMILETSFLGSFNECPIAADPDLSNKKGHTHRGLKLALALTFSMVFMLIGLLILAFSCRRKTKKWVVKQDSFESFQTDSIVDVKQADSVPVVIFEKPLLSFTFGDLLSATNNFDRAALLAEGKFGPVYRGVLTGEIHVAVKVLVHGSAMADPEAARELEYLGRIRHPNLVPLAGYCLAGDQRIAIYHYIENGNLENLLHDNVRPDGPITSWGFRHQIALGIARALAFLHHGCSPPIIHRDVKASSVYLDSNFEPKLCDFGLAKIFGYSLEDEKTSNGYTPPEFLQPEMSSSLKAVTPKCDVYSFGVILFELITGKKPEGDDYSGEKGNNLVTWVRGLVRKNESSRAVDPKLLGTTSEAEMIETLKIGYLCTAEHPSKRPSMQQIVGLLKDIETTTQR